MARIRSIKPEFHQHEGLATLSALHRLLYIALWNIADREGRLEDRPQRIKVQALPYDDCDIDRMLDDLAAPPGLFILRYQVASRRYICIPSFLEHQRPHANEIESIIPGLDECTTLVNSEHDQIRKDFVWRLRQERRLRQEGSKSGGGRKRPAAGRTRRVPDSFTLTDDLRAFALGRGLEAAAVDDEWEKFRDHEFRDARSDWAATWRTWVRNAAKWRREGAPAPQRTPPPTAAARSMASVRDAFGPGGADILPALPILGAK